jgi:hypothetical protein
MAVAPAYNEEMERAELHAVGLRPALDTARDFAVHSPGSIERCLLDTAWIESTPRRSAPHRFLNASAVSISVILRYG